MSDKTLIEITPFKFKCEKVLPTVYDDSLSYYEQLCKLVSKINEVIELLNQIGDPVSKTYLEQRLTEVKAEINATITLLETKVDNNDAAIRLLISGINQQITQINSSITNINQSIQDLDDKIDENVDNLEDEITESYNNMKTYVDNKVIYVTNPYTANRDTLQNVIDAIAGQTRDKALTATEYDVKELTATAYDAYQLTAYNYDTDGKELLA